MSDHTAHNSKVFKVGIEKFGYRAVRAICEEIAKESAQMLVDFVDGNFVMPDGTTQFPVDTANLHDAVGAGVYSDGKLAYFIPTARATEPQSHNGVKGLYGSELLKTAISAASTEYADKNVWLVAFAAIPYAFKINMSGSPIGRGAGFWDEVIRYIVSVATTKVMQRRKL